MIKTTYNTIQNKGNHLILQTHLKNSSIFNSTLNYIYKNNLPIKYSKYKLNNQINSKTSYPTQSNSRKNSNEKISIKNKRNYSNSNIQIKYNINNNNNTPLSQRIHKQKKNNNKNNKKKKNNNNNNKFYFHIISSIPIKIKNINNNKIILSEKIFDIFNNNNNNNKINKILNLYDFNIKFPQFKLTLKSKNNSNHIQIICESIALSKFMIVFIENDGNNILQTNYNQYKKKICSNYFNNNFAFLEIDKILDGNYLIMIVFSKEYLNSTIRFNLFVNVLNNNNFNDNFNDKYINHHNFNDNFNDNNYYTNMNFNDKYDKYGNYDNKVKYYNDNKDNMKYVKSTKTKHPKKKKNNE